MEYSRNYIQKNPRSSPFNPRNRGKSSDVEYIKSEDASRKNAFDRLDESAAILIQDYAGDTVGVGTDPLKTINHAEISAYVCHKIKGDGNYFYRAISLGLKKSYAS